MRTETNQNNLITAYRLPDMDTYYQIRPAAADRYWMDILTGGWANRCLPLRIANQHGWEILNPYSFEVEWKEKPSLDSIRFTFQEERPQDPQSMFGFGTITWPVPYIFATPPGWNLLVRGPANFWKDGATPLDGIVETDWLPFPFTMSWKITRPFKKIKFEAGEPICLITPVRREDVETFSPEIKNLESNPELLNAYNTWMERRLAATSYGTRGELAVKEQGQYIRGEHPLTGPVRDHQTKLNVKPFTPVDPEPETKHGLPTQTAAAEPGSLWRRITRKKD